MTRRPISALSVLAALGWDAPDFRRGETPMKSYQDLVDSMPFGVRATPGFGLLQNREEVVDALFHIQFLRR